MESRGGRVESMGSDRRSFLGVLCAAVVSPLYSVGGDLGPVDYEHEACLFCDEGIMQVWRKHADGRMDLLAERRVVGESVHYWLGYLRVQIEAWGPMPLVVHADHHGILAWFAAQPGVVARLGEP